MGEEETEEDEAIRSTGKQDRNMRAIREPKYSGRQRDSVKRRKRK